MTKFFLQCVHQLYNIYVNVVTSLQVTRSLAPTGPSPQVSISSSTSSIEQQVPDPKFLIELKATDPVQLTITRTSLQLIKDLAEVWYLHQYYTP